jgi:hypothetical protein
LRIREPRIVQKSNTSQESHRDDAEEERVKKRAAIESKDVPDVYEAWVEKQSAKPVMAKSALKSSEETETSS